MEEEAYEVEAILKQRRVRGGGGEVEYLVKWLNWPEADSTWESEDAFEDARETCAAQLCHAPRLHHG